MDREPKILWLSFSTVFEDTIRNKRVLIILRQLKKLGIRVRLLTSSFCFNPYQHLGLIEHNAAVLLSDNGRVAVYEVDGMLCHVIKSKAATPDDMSSDELSYFFNVVDYVLDDFNPNAVLGFGFDDNSAALRRAINQKGFSYLYLLTTALNRTHDFAYSDAVLTISKYTAGRINPREGISVITIGNFIETENVVVKNRDPYYVSLVNASFTKGISVFVRLALMCREEKIPVKFLVAQRSGSNFFQMIKALHWSNGEPLEVSEKHLPNIEVIDHKGDDFRDIFEVTKVLLMPSLWQENWGQVATEAVFNRIPVICTNSGGLPEAVAGAGILLDLPKVCLEDMTLMPSTEDIMPWYTALQETLNRSFDDEFDRAIEVNSIENSIKRLKKVLSSYLLI